MLKAVSIFSGAYGFGLGAEAAGFRVILAADNALEAISTIRLNRPSLPVFTEDIRSLCVDHNSNIASIAGEGVDLLIGGPPCQSFSTAGRRKGAECERSGSLVYEFLRLLEELRPRAFIFENVKGFLSASIRWRQLPHNNNGKIIDDLHGSVVRSVEDCIRRLGYSCLLRELNAADYGVAQIRRRIFIMGSRDGMPISFPSPTHSQTPSIFEQQWVTLGQVLRDLKADPGTGVHFSARKLKYLRLVPAGQNWRYLPKEIQRESMGKAFYQRAEGAVIGEG
jgi:DNA (cytosine-5)-methyltransferase 1